MAISLRIVGIFYSTDVELDGGSGSVKDVLDAAESQITAGTSFSYGTSRLGGLNSVNVFRAFYEQGFESKVSGRHYPSGEYILSEDLSLLPAYTVWQYYIFDENGVYRNKGSGIVSFEDAEVHDGESVVWRLVSVLAGPTPVSPRLAAAFSG